MKKLGKIKTLTIASLSAVALAVPIAFAQSTGSTTQEDQKVMRGERHGGHGQRWGRGDRAGLFLGGLNLTEDQKARMQTIRSSFQDRTKSLHEALRTKRQELRQASEGGTFNEALATQKLSEMAGLQAKLMGERFKMRQEMFSVLTPDQKTQLEQKRAEFKAKRAERGARRVQ
jgi:Spy/CpxP family protein refolding chaperone